MVDAIFLENFVKVYITTKIVLIKIGLYGFIEKTGESNCDMFAGRIFG